jgi:WD40 repeat protein
MKKTSTFFFCMFALVLTSCDPADGTTTAVATIASKRTATEMIFTETKDTTKEITTDTKIHIGEPILADDRVNTNISADRYLVYSRIEDGRMVSYLYSKEKQEDWILYQSAGGYSIYLSGDQNNIAINDTGWDYLRLYNLETQSSTIFPDKYNCINEYQAVFLSWSTEKNLLAMYCTHKIIIVESASGDKVGEIRNSDYGDLNEYYPLLWSPDGRWMVFDLFAEGDKMDPTKGAFIVDTSCIIQNEECNYVFTPAPHYSVSYMRWRSDNILTFEEEDNIIAFYNPKEEKIVDEVIVPTEYGIGIYSFSWSIDNEYLAFETDMGLFIMELKTGKTEKISWGGTIEFWMDVN